MKKILYIAFAVVALAAVSCSVNDDWKIDRPVDFERSLALKFSCGDMFTRADVDGENNENLIKKIDYFFFPVNAQGKVADTTKFAFHGVFEPEDDGLSIEYTTTVDGAVIGDIFPNGATEAVAFAVANYVDLSGKEADIPDTVKTWKSLRSLKVGPTFYKNGGPGYGLRWPRPMGTAEDSLFFVMTADSVGVQLHTSGNYAIDAEIPLERLASKVTVKLDFENCNDDRGTTDTSDDIMWIAQPTGEEIETRIFLSNAIAHSSLGGPISGSLVADSWGTFNDGSRDLFEYAYDYLNDLVGDPYYYTYPVSLEEGDDNQPYLKLVLLWYGYKGYGTSEQRLYGQKEVYYKIVLPRETITEPNKIYEYSVKVNIIGAEKEVAIKGDYQVKDWPASTPISSNLATGRYISLDIPKDEYNMYSDTVEIAFVSSGEVEILDLKIDQEDFYNLSVNHFITGKNGNNYTYGTGHNGNQTVNYSANTTDHAGTRLPNWVTIDGRYLVVNHQMNNDFSTNSYDVAPMVFTVTLHLKDAEDDHSFDRTVTITQYPALYVTRDEHVGKVIINNRSNPSDSRAVDDNGGNLGSIQNQNDLGTGANTNPNTYNIYVSNLAGHSEGWVIGDPRGEPGLISGLAVTKYRKSSPDASKTIAPAFKVASSYGKVMSDVPTFDQATSRCAAYQENGYPAGRWRVPTEAEIEFCVELSNNQMIPSLFNYSYWASSGRYYNYQSGWHNAQTNTQAAVRCVYDIWYWGEDKSDACKDSGANTYNTWGGYQD